jgi:N-acetylglucosamine kinase-like BadF-type ATPase
MQYYAGVEGGGTSTSVVVSCGNVTIGTAVGSASNPFLLGHNAATKIALLLQQLIAPLVNQHHHNDTEPVPLHCIVMSMSGYGRRKDALVLEKAVVDSGLAKHCIVAGDTAGPLECLKSWITTQPTQPTQPTPPTPNSLPVLTHGLVLISGTGSACFRYTLSSANESKDGQDEKDSREDQVGQVTSLPGDSLPGDAFRQRFSNYDARSGGRGHVMGDQGSAYWIGQQALSTAFLAHDGMATRPSEVALVEIVKEFYQLNQLVDVIPLVHDPVEGKTKVASLCERIVQEARTNPKSHATREIVQRAAEWLANMTNALIPNGGGGGGGGGGGQDKTTATSDVHIVVLLVGSVWKSYDMLRPHYIGGLQLPTVNSTIDLVRLKETAAYGCVDAAVRMFGTGEGKGTERSGSFTHAAAASAVQTIEIVQHE